MKASEEIKTKMKAWEGLRLKAYYCSAGKLTIGYGHTGNDVKSGMVITQKQADELFDKDIAVFETGLVQPLSGIALNQYQYDALLSFSYNCGLANLKASTLLKKVKANPSDTSIRNEFNKWVKSGGKVLGGLITRRNEEANWYFKG